MRYFYIIMITLCLTLTGSVTSQAQQRGRGERSERTVTREELAEKQARYIAHVIALDDKTTERFVKTYGDFQKEIWALGPRVSRRKQAERDTDANMQQRFERSKQILAIREKYYNIYRQFLTPKQIDRVYELERQMMRQLEHRHSQRRVK